MGLKKKTVAKSIENDDTEGEPQDSKTNIPE